MASAAQAAAHIDLSRVAFAELIAKGIITKPAKQGGYDLDKVRLAYIRHMRKVASGRAGGSGADRLTDQRVRLATAKAEREERQNSIERREWAHLPSVARYLRPLFLGIRDHLLNLPGEVAYAIAMQPQEECFRILDDAIREKLEEIADPATPLRVAEAGLSPDGVGDDGERVSPDAVNSGLDDGEDQ